MRQKLLILLLFGGLNSAYSQVNIQHYEGIMGAEISVSKTPIGTTLKGGISKYISNNIYWKVSAGYGTGRKYQILIRDFNLDAAVFYSPLNLDGLVFINIAAGPVLTYERLLNFEPSRKGSLNAGGKAGMELEVPVFDGLLLIANGYQQFLLKKDYGQKRIEFGLGMKIIIN
jgi:hypothetical protein